jgi:hypothetical protein
MGRDGGRYKTRKQNRGRDGARQDTNHGFNPSSNVQLPPPGTLASHRVGFGPQLRRRIGGFPAPSAKTLSRARRNGLSLSP